MCCKLCQFEWPDGHDVLARGADVGPQGGVVRVVKDGVTAGPDPRHRRDVTRELRLARDWAVSCVVKSI